MNTIIVLGGNGMLGHKMTQALRGRFPDTTCTIRGSASAADHKKIQLFQEVNVIDNVNAMSHGELRELLRECRPQITVNCVGVVKQRCEAQDPYLSIGINSFLPHMLADTCSEWGGRVIHFSTDCVFSGKRGGYVEDDSSDAEDLYGKTKYLGEVTAGNALTLRTSIIGRELTGYKSLLEWFISQNHSTVKGYSRVIYSGVTTNYLADIVVGLIKSHPTLSGLYQVTSEPISKHDLLCLLRDAYDLDIEVVPDENFFCDRSMNGDKFRRATKTQCPPWKELVAELANDSTPYYKWR